MMHPPRGKAAAVLSAVAVASLLAACGQPTPPTGAAAGVSPSPSAAPVTTAAAPAPPPKATTTPPKATTAPPKPKPKPAPTSKRPSPRTSPKPPIPKTDPRYGTCKEAIAHGLGPYRRGVDPEYYWYRDADHDGVVCER